MTNVFQSLSLSLQGRRRSWERGCFSLAVGRTNIHYSLTETVKFHIPNVRTVNICLAFAFLSRYLQFIILLPPPIHDQCLCLWELWQDLSIENCPFCQNHHIRQINGNILPFLILRGFLGIWDMLYDLTTRKPKTSTRKKQK